MPGTVGTELRQARERAQLSLEDLSARTKIRTMLLAAMERDDFERLPPGLLTRGYLRAYAREVGLDSEAVVRHYVAEHEPEPPAPDTEREEAPEPEWEPAPPGAARWATLLPAIPLTLAAIFFLRMQRPAEVAPIEPLSIGTAGQQVAFAHATPASADGPAAIGQTGAALAAAPNDGGLRVEIHPTAVVWVEAAADGRQVLFELVEPGAKHTIEAETDITMRIGDAGAFAYSINGTPGRTLGAPGEVRVVRITPETVDSFVNPN